MKTNNFIKMLVIPLIIGILNTFILLFPYDVISSARGGLLLWFNNVVPSLLPFIVGTNLLMELGFISFIGALAEPIMRPLFGVCGACSYPLAVGFTSGYPVGAKTICTLRENGEITRTEAEKMIAFCNNAGPLFIVGAVGVSMFSDAHIGYFILLCNTIGALLTGLLFKHYKLKKTSYSVQQKNLLSFSLKNMHARRRIEKKGIGKILTDSIKNTTETLTLVGGFMVFFSVASKVVELTGVFNLLNPTLRFFSIDLKLFHAFLSSLIEVSNGSSQIASCELSRIQLSFLAFAISFGGLCIFAQTLSFVGKTDISKAFVFVSKSICAAITSLIAFFVFPFFSFSSSTKSAFAQVESNMVDRINSSITLFFVATVALICLTVFVQVVKKVKKYIQF